MKSLYRVLYIAIMATLLLGSCSDDDLYRVNQAGSELIEMNGVRYSVFTVSNKIIKLPANLTEVLIKMRSRTNDTSYDFKAKVKNVDIERLTCMLPLGNGEKLPDGDYEMTIKAKENAPGLKITVAFIDEMLYEINNEQVKYPLDGDGTKDNPYEIQSANNLDSLLITLTQYDVTYGRGLYFKQTASIDLTQIKSFQSDKGYHGAPFAGHYNGGGFEIQNLHYSGEYKSMSLSPGDTDNYIGLFTKLLDGATVQNLTFSNLNMRGIKLYGGAVAGSTSGNVSISNIILRSGSIDNSGNYIGGVVGYCQGTLNLSNITSYLKVKAEVNVGGCIGFADNTIVSISNITLNNTSFTVQSTSCSGGLIGKMTGSCTIDNVILSHMITDEDNEMRVIFSSGNNCGGLIGELISQEKIVVSNIDIACPVTSAANNIGGLIGSSTLSHDLEITNAAYYSFLEGKDNVGGFIGNLVGNDNCSILLKGDDNRLVKKGNSNGKIKGISNVGGIVGSLSKCLLLDISNLFEMVINIEASTSVGGIIGYAQKSSVNTGGFSSSDGMKIWGSKRVGGLIGYANNCNNILGTTTVTLSKQNPITSIPAGSTFNTETKGYVTGIDAVGGAIGEVLGSKSTVIRGLCVSSHLEYPIGGPSFTNIGGIIGKSFELKKIEQCVYRGEIRGDAAAGSSFIGGIVGGLRGENTRLEMEDCINYGDVYGDFNIGGIVGECVVKEKDFYLKYNVNCGTVAGKENVGGIVGHTSATNLPLYGYSEYKTIDACANYGQVKGVGKYSSSSWVGVGGIVGKMAHNESFITRCANYGKVTGNGRKYCVGGIGGKIGNDPVGYDQHNNYSVQKNCNYGELSSNNNDSRIGGIIGFMEEGDAILESSFTNSYVLSDCYNAGPITSDQSDNNGGIVGYVDHLSGVYRNINTGLVSYGNAIVGTRKSAAIIYHEYNYYLNGTGKDWYATASYPVEKGSQTASFKTFNFDGIWAPGDAISNSPKNNGFPYLRNCPFQWTTYKAK